MLAFTPWNSTSHRPTLHRSVSLTARARIFYHIFCYFCCFSLRMRSTGTLVAPRSNQATQIGIALDRTALGHVVHRVCAALLESRDVRIPGEKWLCLIYHHSHRLLQEDLETYDGIAAGKPGQVPPKNQRSVSFSYFLNWSCFCIVHFYSENESTFRESAF